MPANAVWQNAQAVCFDVDSTVCTEEGIDVLAKYCGVEDQVKHWTTRAMEGEVKFEHALKARLEIIQPRKQDIEACLRHFPPRFSPGIVPLFQQLRERQVPTYLVSGGFRAMIAPVADALHVPFTRVFANTIWFDDATGAYAGFDSNEPTSRDGGKASALTRIQERGKYENMVMIGDGMTDVQAKPPARLVIGYGGVVMRQTVQAQADWYITDFHELINALKPPQSS